jgi:hypothetical protein
VLTRSKSVTWQTCGRFFAVGALVAAPGAAAATGVLHALFGGDPSALWSAAGWAPLLEELAKLAPLLLFCAGTSRARSLGVADLGLVGAAVGAGFACTEEAVRRVAVGATAVGDQAVAGLADWRLLALLPGQASDAGRSFAGHAVLTALVGLGVGFALRYRSASGRVPALLPVALFLLAVADHAAWNGRDGLSDRLLGAHDVLGAGGVAAPLLLALLAGATIVDYRDLNRRRPWLPLLPGETRLNPLAELRLLARLAPAGLPGAASLSAFLRRRRRLGYGLAQPEARRDEALGALAARVAGHARQLGGLLDRSPVPRLGAATTLLAGLGLAAAASRPPAAGLRPVAAWLDPASRGPAMAAGVAPNGPRGGGASVASWFVQLGPWWSALPWSGRLAAAATVAALTGIAIGGWTAGLGVALVARDAADGHEDLVHFRQDPRGTVRLWLLDLTPAQLFAYATSALLDLLLRRVPPDDESRLRARRWPYGLLPGGVDTAALFHGRLTPDGVPIGFAHRGSIGAAPWARVVPGTATEPDEAGVYRAVAELRDERRDRWVRRRAPTAFFPDAWSRARVLAEIRGALEEAVVEGQYWTGTAPSGLRVHGLVDADGTVRTAHPVTPEPEPWTTSARALPVAGGRGASGTVGGGHLVEKLGEQGLDPLVRSAPVGEVLGEQG